MGNVSGRTAIELANVIHGVSPQNGLLNLVFEIHDGGLVVETLEGDAGVDLADINRLRLLMGCVVFNDQSARLAQAFHAGEDKTAALERLHEIVDAMSGAHVEEHLLAAAVNAHPELRTLVALTYERGQDGAEAYRLYRNPHVDRDAAIGFLVGLRSDLRGHNVGLAKPGSPKN